MTAAHCQVSRLPSGLTVATATMPEMTSVCVGFWIRVGSRYETAESNGIYHFIEHMLFKGTRKRSAREITQSVEGIGGTLDAFTGEENTCIYARAHADHLEHLIDVIVDMLSASRFDPADVAKEQNVIKEELAMYLDQPQHLVDDLVCETLWPNHPLGRPLTGTPRTIDRFTRERVLASHRGGYLAGNSVVVIAGPVGHRRAVRLLSRADQRLRHGPPPAFIPAQASQAAPCIRVVRKSASQTQIALAFRTCSRHDRRRHALRVLNVLLGENMSSRLFQVVREDEGLAYNIHSCLNWFADTGNLVVYVGVDPGDVSFALKLIVRELSRIAARPPSPRELRAARDYLLGQIDLGLEGSENQMMWIGEHLMDFGAVISPATAKRRLSAVMASEVQAVAREFFTSAGANLAMVGPRKANGELEGILKRLH